MSETSAQLETVSEADPLPGQSSVVFGPSSTLAGPSQSSRKKKRKRTARNITSEVADRIDGGVSSSGRQVTRFSQL